MGCLTKNTMRRRKLPPTPLKREMETSRKPDKKPRRVNSMNNSVNISTNGENRDPRRKRNSRNLSRNYRIATILAIDSFHHYLHRHFVFVPVLFFHRHSCPYFPSHFPSKHRIFVPVHIA